MARSYCTVNCPPARRTGQTDRPRDHANAWLSVTLCPARQRARSRSTKARSAKASAHTGEGARGGAVSSPAAEIGAASAASMMLATARTGQRARTRVFLRWREKGASGSFSPASVHLGRRYCRRCAPSGSKREVAAGRRAFICPISMLSRPIKINGCA